MFGNKIVTDENKINELFSRYIRDILPSKEKAKELLKSGKQLSFYSGIDPTGPDIHLGHTTNLLFLKKLKFLGHKIILLVGDFTAKIGDPTDKESARIKLSEKQVKENMRTYLGQVYKILPKGSFDVAYNSRWLKNMTWDNGMEIASNFTVQQMIIRDMFQKRIQDQKPIYLQEFMYPLMQGYDSVALKVDGEVGGTDQTFNMLIGRDLEKIILGKEKLVFSTKLLENPDTGKKMMSKSEGHYISLNDSSKDMYGKIMAMPDSVILPLFENTTEVPEQKLKEIRERIEKQENPKNIKKELAFELVKMYFSETEAQKTEKEFEKIFIEGGLPSEIEEVKVSGSITTAIAGTLNVSNSEIKRLMNEKAVSVNGEIITDWHYEIKAGDTIKIGPRRFIKII